MKRHRGSAGTAQEGWMEWHPWQGTSPGEMEGHWGTASTYPTWFLTAQILILATEDPKNAVLLRGMWPFPPARSLGTHPLPLPGRVYIVVSLFTISIHLHTLAKDKRRCWLGSISFDFAQRTTPHTTLNTQFPSCMSITAKPTAVKQAPKTENFGLMLDFKTFQTKMNSYIFIYMKNRRAPLAGEDYSSPLPFFPIHPRNCIPVGSHQLMSLTTDVRVKMTLLRYARLQAGLENYMHAESSI